jgi:hypothetical protein
VVRLLYALCCLFTVWLTYIFYVIKHCILLHIFQTDIMLINCYTHTKYYQR